MKRVLVTGGGGFIGRHVVRELVGAGWTVRVMLAPEEPAHLLEGLDVAETVVGDVRDLPSLDAAVDGCTAVVHMAAIYALWMADYRPLYDVNVQGTVNVMEACRRAGVERIVYTSSIAALGVLPGEATADATTPFNQRGRCPHYITSKAEAEVRVRALQDDGLPVVIVYPGMPYGPGDHRPTPTGLTVLRVLGGAYFLAGPGGINAVDVRDVATGHLLALERGEQGGRYLLSGHNISMDGMFTLIKQVGGVERAHRAAPPWALWLLGAIGDLVGRVTEPLVDSRTVRYTSQFLYYDCSHTERALGWTRRPLDETLADAVAWFREHGYPEPGMGLTALGARRQLRLASSKERNG